MVNCNGLKRCIFETRPSFSHLHENGEPAKQNRQKALNGNLAAKFLLLHFHKLFIVVAEMETRRPSFYFWTFTNCSLLSQKWKLGGQVSIFYFFSFFIVWPCFHNHIFVVLRIIQHFSGFFLILPSFHIAFLRHLKYPPVKLPVSELAVGNRLGSGDMAALPCQSPFRHPDRP